MSRIFELKNKRTKLVDEFKAIVAKDADRPDDENTPDEETDRLTAIEGTIAKLDAKIAALTKSESLDNGEQVLKSESVEDDDHDEKSLTGLVTKQFGYGRPTVAAQPAVKLEKGLQAARFVIGKALARTMGDRGAADMISKRFNDDMVAKSLLSVSASGSNVIPTYFSTDIIELLRPQVVVRNIGTLVVQTDGGNLTIPSLTGAATAQWQTENADIGASVETFSDVVLSNHKLTALVPVSNDLIRRSPVGIDSIVREDLLAVIARAEDLAFLVGATGGANPVGIKNISGIQSFYVATSGAAGSLGTAATSNLSDVTYAVNAAITKLQMANSRLRNPCWIMSPMVKNFLSTQRDAVGGFFVYEQELAKNTLAGYPVFTTSVLPSNLAAYGAAGAAGNGRGQDIFFLDAADLVIGDTMQIQLDVSDTASYINGSTLTSAFSTDVTLFRVIRETDLGCRHPVSIVNIKCDSWCLY